MGCPAWPDQCEYNTRGRFIISCAGETGGTYEAFSEPKDQKKPKQKRAVIVPYVNNAPAGDRIELTVHPVFRWLSQLHQHGPNAQPHVPTDDDYNKAWQYALWKYDGTDGLGALTGNLGGFGSISFTRSQATPGRVLKNVFGVNTMTLGLGAFSSENKCASTLGHENVHCGQTYWFQLNSDEKEIELPAWQWEHDNATGTKLSDPEKEEVDEWVNYYQTLWPDGPRP